MAGDCFLTVADNCKGKVVFVHTMEADIDSLFLKLGITWW